MEHRKGFSGLVHVSIGVDEDLVQNHFWNPQEDGDLILNPDITSLEELAVLVGIFPSKGQARKNGMMNSIPYGINLLGTKKNKVWVWRSPPTTFYIYNTFLKPIVKVDKFWNGTIETSTP